MIDYYLCVRVRFLIQTYTNIKTSTDIKDKQSRIDVVKRLRKDMIVPRLPLGSVRSSPPEHAPG